MPPLAVYPIGFDSVTFWIPKISTGSLILVQLNHRFSNAINRLS